MKFQLFIALALANIAIASPVPIEADGATQGVEAADTTPLPVDVVELTNTTEIVTNMLGPGGPEDDDRLPSYPNDNRVGPPGRCQTYVSHVWNAYHRAVNENTWAFWCENCPKDIDMKRAGMLYGSDHAAHLCSKGLPGSGPWNLYRETHYSTRWKKWVVKSSEPVGPIGWKNAWCLVSDFAEKLQGSICPHGFEKPIIQNWGGSRGTWDSGHL